MRKIILCAFALAAAALVGQQSGIFPVLESGIAIGKQPGGFFLLPSNQLLRPWGEQTVIPGRPVDMTYDSQRRILAVLNTRSILLLDGSTGTKVAEIAARSTSYAGIAFRPGDRELWASETSRNGPDSILIAKISELGIFDSGVGGLPVLKALLGRLPHSDFVYVGDTAPVPYGRKPKEMVRGFANEIAGFLLKIDVS